MKRDFNKKVLRLLRLYDRLNSGQMLRLPDLAAEFRVSLRSLQRDMADLQEMHLPIVDVRRDGLLCYTMRDQQGRTPVNFREVDIIVVMLALRMLQHYEGTGLPSYVQDLARRITDRLNGILSVRFKGFDRKVYSHAAFPRKYTGREDIFDEVVTALLYQQKLDITYRAANGRTNSYILRPFTLVVYKSGLYMLALPEHAPEGVNPSTFALERIRKCKRISAETFEIPASFDPGACFPALVGMLPGAEQEMEVWFDGNVRDYIKSIRWPESCSLTDAGKGAVLLSGRLAASDELIHWICGFGNLAEVKSPPSLRETVISHLKQTLSRYVQDV